MWPDTRQRLLVTMPVLLFLVGSIARGVWAKPKTHDFWGNIVDPGRKEFDAALRRGQKILRQAFTIKQPRLRKKMYLDALATFKEAVRASPKNPKGWFFMGSIHYELNQLKESIASYLKVRQLAPEEKADEVAFNLGIAYSKIGAFEKAVLEYDRAGQVNNLSGRNSYERTQWRALLQGNSAEALMALGRLDEAIQRYKEALTNNPSNALIRWGLAVAYDRDEQVSNAIQNVQMALSSTHKMAILTSNNVFFIPEGDIHYYFALGYEVQGNAELAKKHWKLFLEKLPKSQWASRARVHLAQLGVSTKKPSRQRARLAPVPRSRADQSEIIKRDRSNIHYRISNNSYRFRRCYNQALKKRPNFVGELQVFFVVGTSGRASKVRVIRSTMRDKLFHQCIVGAVKDIYFGHPSSNKPIKVTHPFEFQI